CSARASSRGTHPSFANQMHASRLQILLTIVAGLFLLGTVAIFAVFALAPGTAVVYRPFLLTAFVVTLFISLVCVACLMRGLFRPYSQRSEERRVGKGCRCGMLTARATVETV